MLDLLNENDILKNYRFYWIYKGKKEYKKNLKKFQTLIKNSLYKKKNNYFKFNKELIDIHNLFLSSFIIDKKNLENSLNIFKNNGIKYKKVSLNYYIEYKRVLIKIVFFGKENINNNKKLIKLISELLYKFSNKLRNIVTKLKEYSHNKFHNKYLSYSEFRNLYIIDINDNLDNFYRFEHFKIITNDFKNLTIGKIIDYYKNIDNLNFLKDKLIDPKDITLKTNYPRHCDYFFWKNGNSFFANNIIFGFKNNIPQYESVNKMIDNEGKIIFSENYYNNQKEMTENEIKEIFINQPIKIKNNIILNGRHRVCAMIGRIIKNKKYIPISLKRSI